MISTVSGGTFTGARYALSQAEGKSFSEFFKGFYQDLASTHLPSLWLEELNAQRTSETSGELKLIKAAANVYNQRLLTMLNSVRYLTQPRIFISRKSSLMPLSLTMD
jgi:hypothetical protein